MPASSFVTVYLRSHPHVLELGTILFQGNVEQLKKMEQFNAASFIWHINTLFVVRWTCYTLCDRLLIKY